MLISLIDLAYPPPSTRLPQDPSSRLEIPGENYVPLLAEVSLERLFSRGDYR